MLDLIEWNVYLFMYQIEGIRFGNEKFDAWIGPQFITCPLLMECFPIAWYLKFCKF